MRDVTEDGLGAAEGRRAGPVWLPVRKVGPIGVGGAAPGAVCRSEMEGAGMSDRWPGWVCRIGEVGGAAVRVGLSVIGATCAWIGTSATARGVRG